MASLFKLNISRISEKTLNTVEVFQSKMWVPTYPTAHECLNLCDEQVPELGINLDLFVLFLGGEEIAKFLLPVCLKSPTEFYCRCFFLRLFLQTCNSRVLFSTKIILVVENSWRIAFRLGNFS